MFVIISVYIQGDEIMAKDLMIRSSYAEFLILKDKLMIKEYKLGLKMAIYG